MADLSLLRLHPRDEDDLRWFFEQAEGALGLSSNHQQIVNAALVGRGQGRKAAGAARSFEVSERQHHAADRASRVARRLKAMTARDRRTLAAAYGGLALPRDQLADWERLAARAVSPELLYEIARRHPPLWAALPARADGRKPTLADLASYLGGPDAQAQRRLRQALAQARIALAVASAAYELAR